MTLLRLIAVVAAYPRTTPSHPVSDAEGGVGGQGPRTDHERTTDARARRSAAADYNQLQVGSLTSWIRTLGADDLQTLIDYERSHAKRVQVMAVMENRLTSLKAGAQPSGGDPAAATPESAPGRGRRVEGLRGDVRPPVNPPSHGDPSNLSQPR